MDMYAASRYQPTEQVASIRDNLKLTDEGGTLLYASAPSIKGGQDFNSACESTERTQAILGCYSVRKIYLFDITNQQLAGAEEVTAAHEMLHAAYDRLNFIKRPTVDALLQQEYEKIKNDAEISKLVAYYEKAEPGAIDNELHSIIGTTIADLPPALERYYGRYFTDRQVVVAMNQSYNAVFQKVNEQSKQLASQINALKPQIESELKQYQADLQQLNDDVATFNSQAKSGGFKTQSAFNAARQALVGRVTAMNERRDRINADVAAYNALVTEQNKLSVQVDQLNSSINAAPAAGGV